MEKKSDNYGKHYFCRDFQEAKSSDETNKSSKTLAIKDDHTSTSIESQSLWNSDWLFFEEDEHPKLNKEIQMVK